MRYAGSSGGTPTWSAELMLHEGAWDDMHGVGGMVLHGRHGYRFAGKGVYSVVACMQVCMVGMGIDVTGERK